MSFQFALFYLHSHKSQICLRGLSNLNSTTLVFESVPIKDGKPNLSSDSLIPLSIFNFVLLSLCACCLHCMSSAVLYCKLCPSVWFMYDWEQHCVTLAARLLVSLMLCRCFKQFRVPVASVSSGGHTGASQGVCFSCHCLCSMCFILVPSACQRNRSLPTSSQILAHSSTFRLSSGEEMEHLSNWL